MSKAIPAAPAQEDKWQAEDDMRTLARAEEIKRDPKRLSKARACAKTKLAELKSIVAGAK